MARHGKQIPSPLPLGISRPSPRKVLKRQAVKRNHGIAEKFLLVLFASFLILSMILWLR